MRNDEIPAPGSSSLTNRDRQAWMPLRDPAFFASGTSEYTSLSMWICAARILGRELRVHDTGVSSCPGTQRMVLVPSRASTLRCDELNVLNPSTCSGSVPEPVTDVQSDTIVSLDITRSHWAYTARKEFV